ncbi:MAG: DNA internalization-related competence protein ComEC/Rec2 [Desulfuromonadales bacterium]|nr:DNA internalization-related competence protein ComEC/Rec2 [Desulfuromonadales bacterium]
MILQERPLLLPFLALAVGLTVADQTGFRMPLYGVAAFLACLILSCLTRRRTLFVVCVALFFFALGLCALSPWKTPQYPSASIRTMAGPQSLTLEGVVRSRPVASPDGTSLLVRTEQLFRGGSREAVSGDLMLYVPEGEVSLDQGDRIRFTTRVTVPRRLGLPGEFDYPRYLAFQGVAAIGRVASPEDVVLIRGAAQDSLQRRVDLVARRLGDFIRASVPDEEVSSVLTALLIGDQKRIPADLAAAYTRAGVNHILSISGFHVGIISYFIVMAALLLATRSEYLALRFNLRRAVLLLSLPAMLYYLVLTGSAPATARSVIMLAAFVLALYAERETDPVNALLVAAFLLVAVNPPSLFDISFQLSFLALWGICVIVPPFMERFVRTERRWLRTLLQFVAASCAASLATAVPVLFVFNQASLNGVVSNFLIVPILGYGAVLAGFCALPFVYLFPPLATLLLLIAAKMVLVSNWLIELFAGLPVLSFHGITRLDMLLFLAVMCAATFLRGRKMKTCLCLLLPAAAVVAHLFAPSGADGRLHITMLSVGQAESLLLRLPDGAVVLVDGGGYLHDTGRDFGERTLAPALFKLGVRRIDHMILTHCHPDHIGGFPFVAGTFPVGSFWEATPGGIGDQYDQLRAALDRNRVPIRQLAAGDGITLSGGVSLRVLSPRTLQKRPGMQANDMDLNEDSLVFRLSYGSFSMLFTADSGFPAEERMLADGRDLRSTVLKVGHHGSRYSTSEAFLKRVAPKLAMISAGRGNRFGLPSPDTLDSLERRGIPVWRTDYDGTVELVSDGLIWSVSSICSAD